jgi:nitrogen fixation NifU-like protein
MSYSETLMDHFSSPRNQGLMPDPDRVGRAGSPGRGPFLILYLRLGGGRVSEARFQTYGCGATIASGSALTEAITGREVGECLRLTAQDLIDALDGMPPTKLHAPELAIVALRDALAPRPESTRD